MSLPILKTDETTCTDCRDIVDLSFVTAVGDLCMRCFSEECSASNEAGQVVFGLTDRLTKSVDEQVAEEPVRPKKTRAKAKE